MFSNCMKHTMRHNRKCIVRMDGMLIKYAADCNESLQDERFEIDDFFEMEVQLYICS